MLTAGTPVPVSPELIRVSNDWLVSDGVTLVAVYAGSAGTSPATGRFVIVRQNSQTGKQTVNLVSVPGTQAISIVSPPTGSAVESSAQKGYLAFRTASGSAGKLNLSNDAVSEAFPS
jgi:hypothetical protein